MNVPLKATRLDTADDLRTDEERAAHLAAALDEAPDDAAFIANAPGSVARSRK